MTENEAEEKWCPMVRVNYSNDQNCAVNKPDYNNIDIETRCIASDCMMWRWEGLECEHGFCGLAGKHIIR